MAKPEGLFHSVCAQVKDLDKVISGAGQQLSAVMVQIQRGHSAQQFKLVHYTLRSEHKPYTAHETHCSYCYCHITTRSSYMHKKWRCLGITWKNVFSLVRETKLRK